MDNMSPERKNEVEGIVATLIIFVVSAVVFVFTKSDLLIILGYAILMLTAAVFLCVLIVMLIYWMFTSDKLPIIVYFLIYLGLITSAVFGFVIVTTFIV